MVREEAATSSTKHCNSVMRWCWTLCTLCTMYVARWLKSLFLFQFPRKTVLKKDDYERKKINFVALGKLRVFFPDGIKQKICILMECKEEGRPSSSAKLKFPSLLVSMRRFDAPEGSLIMEMFFKLIILELCFLYFHSINLRSFYCL